MKMSKVNIGERMAKIETTLEYIKESMDNNRKEHKEILDLMTKELELKADKSEVDFLKEQIEYREQNNWKWVNWIPALILIILTLINMFVL